MRKKLPVYMNISARLAVAIILVVVIAAFFHVEMVQATTLLDASPTAAVRQPVATRITATYNGPPVIVGQEYDKTKLMVTVHFDLGGLEKLEPTEYTVSSDVVTKNGSNTIIVMYKDLVTTVSIYGKSLVNINVSPLREDFGIGNMPDALDLMVTGNYSDGSIEDITEGFEIYPEKLIRLGKEEVTVIYEGKVATCSVYVRDWSEVVALNATYNKSEIPTNCPLDKNDFTVVVVYSNMMSERVTTFSMSCDMFLESGKQPLTITYGGVSKTIDLNVIERYVVGLRAEYTGGSVIAGRNFRRDNLHVYIKYVDGQEVETNDYTLHSMKIRYVGNNTVTAYYGDKFSADVTIEGVELVRPNFDYVSTGVADNGTSLVKVDTAIPSYLGQESVKVEGLKNKVVKKAYRRLGLKTGKYIAFEYGFEDDNDELELPLTVRITIPEGFDMDHTFLYYCPNRKTILGQMNKKVINSRTFETTLFKVGTYMLVYSEELKEDEG